MNEEDGKMVCTSDNNHVLRMEEVNQYINDEKTFDWLKFRMKIRRGKLIHRR